MVKVTLPEQQQDKKPSYPYFANGRFSGNIYYVVSKDYAICILPGFSNKKQGEYVNGFSEKNLTPIVGPITFENVFE